MRHVCHEIVPDGVAGRVQSRVGLDVGRHVEGANGEDDDGGVTLRDELVLGEAFDVEQEVRGKWVEEAIAFTHVEVLLGFQPVVFGEDGCEGDLR